MFLEALQLLPKGNNSSLSAVLESGDQPVRAFTCHVNDFFRFNGKYLSCVQFGHAQFYLKTATFH